MIDQILQISKPCTNLFENPEISLKISSQCLFGELFQIKLIEGNWFYGKLLSDGYEGYIKKTDVSENILKTNYFVQNIRTIVMSKPDYKSEEIINLPIGAQLCLINIKDNWAKIRIDRGKFGYILERHILNNTSLLDDWVKIAEKFLDVPYRWGGKESLGIDCSGLVQLSFSLIGTKIPRDSNDQFQFFKKSKKFSIINSLSENTLKRGDLIYWEGHIAIVKDEESVIHASGFHGNVVEERINNVLLRINSKPTFIISY